MKIQKHLSKIAAVAFFSLMIVSPELFAQEQGTGAASGGRSQTVQAGNDIFPALPGEGQRCDIGNGYYFQYSFDKKPQMGMVILKIEVFDKEGKKDTSFAISGDAGMPTMRGHHDTGMIGFKISNKGDYLLPVNVVMPGQWDIRLIFSKDGNAVYRGAINFNV